MKKASQKRIVFICMGLLISIICASIAMADFYVIAAGKKARKTILVSPKSTQIESGAALLNAINGITDASVTNPYLIIIEPGNYSVGSNTLEMKEYVDIQGSGEEPTNIRGEANGYTNGVIKGADNAELRFLQVTYSGNEGEAGSAISNISASPKITNVFIFSFHGDTNYGIYNDDSSPILSDVRIKVMSGEDYNYGVYNYNASHPIMNNVRIEVIGNDADIDTCGISNTLGSNPEISNTYISVSDGGNNKGVYVGLGCSPILKNVTIKALDGVGGANHGIHLITNTTSDPQMSYLDIESKGNVSNWGIRNVNNNGVTMKIDHSLIYGSPYALRTDSGETTHIGTSRIRGIIDGAGTNKCAFVYKDPGYTMLESDCTPP